KQKGSRGIRRGQWYRLVFQFPIRQVFFPPFLKKNAIKYRQLHSCNARQGMEGAKENTREQRGHIAPKRGAAADEHTRMHRAIPSPCKARTDQQAMIMLICAAECRS
ncbi:hypothetical protein JYG48_22900, partial [Escherichia fergusonii]|uniref:hypothetical protein n=3 Tax=Escherichia fergusonii TaxID=564 RepID=UPI001CC00067